jgi:hypothetical protein
VHERDGGAGATVVEVGNKVGEGGGVVAAGGGGVSEVVEGDGFGVSEVDSGGILELEDEDCEKCAVNIGGRGGWKVLDAVDNELAGPLVDDELEALAEPEPEKDDDDDWLIEESLDESSTEAELDIDPTDFCDVGIAEENCCVPDPEAKEGTDVP